MIVITLQVIDRVRLYDEITPELERGVIDHTGVQPMLYITCTMIPSVDLAHYRTEYLVLKIECLWNVVRTRERERERERERVHPAKPNMQRNSTHLTLYHSPLKLPRGRVITIPDFRLQVSGWVRILLKVRSYRAEALHCTQRFTLTLPSFDMT